MRVLFAARQLASFAKQASQATHAAMAASAHVAKPTMRISHTGTEKKLPLPQCHRASYCFFDSFRHLFHISHAQLVFNLVCLFGAVALPFLRCSLLVARARLSLLKLLHMLLFLCFAACHCYFFLSPSILVVLPLPMKASLSFPSMPLLLRTSFSISRVVRSTVPEFYLTPLSFTHLKLHPLLPPSVHFGTEVVLEAAAGAAASGLPPLLRPSCCVFHFPLSPCSHSSSFLVFH